MGSKYNRFVSLLRNNEPFPHVMHFRCSIHFGILTSHLESVPEISEHVDVIVNVINFSLAKPLKQTSAENQNGLFIVAILGTNSSC